MRTLALALLTACAAAVWAASDQVPGTEAADRGNPEAGRGGDALTPGSEQDLQENRAAQDKLKGSFEPGSDYRPKIKPTGLILAGLAAGILGLVVVRRRRHRGRGQPSDDFHNRGGPPPGPRV